MLLILIFWKAFSYSLTLLCCRKCTNVLWRVKIPDKWLRTLYILLVNDNLFWLMRNNVIILTVIIQVCQVLSLYSLFNLNWCSSWTIGIYLPYCLKNYLCRTFGWKNRLWSLSCKLLLIPQIVRQLFEWFVWGIIYKNSIRLFQRNWVYNILYLIFRLLRFLVNWMNTHVITSISWIMGILRILRLKPFSVL